STQAISDLYVAKVSSAQQANVQVTLGDMIVERVDATTGSALVAQHSIIDAIDDADGPIINVATGDLYLQAGQDVGSADNFFDVQVGGALSGAVGNDAFINSPSNLTVSDFTSTNHNVTLTVGATTNVGIIRAHRGVVKITSQNDIVDFGNES